MSKLQRFLLYSIFFFAPFRNARFFPIITLQDVAILLLLISLTIRRPSQALPVATIPFFLFGCIFLLLVTLQGYLVSVDPIVSSINSLKFFLTFCLLPIAFLILKPDHLDTEKLLKYFVSGSACSCLGAIIFHIGTDSNSGGRATGFAGHPVFFGILNGLALSIALTFLFSARKISMLNYVGISSLTYGLILSASTTGMLFPLITLLFLLLKNLKDLSLMKVTISACLLMISIYSFMNLSLLSFAKSRFLQTIHPKTGYSTIGLPGTSTLEARLISVRAGLQKIGQSPILGNGLDPQGRSTNVGLEPHNFFVLSWQTGGIMLFTLALFLFFISLKSMIQALRENALVEVVVVTTTWLALFSCPLLYERSVVTPLLLICSKRFLKRSA